MIQLKIIVPILMIILLFSGTRGISASISESELQGISSGFLSKLISDSPDYRQSITECMNGIIKGNNSAIKLIDKMGLFLYDSKKKGITVSRTRFYFNKGTFFILILFRDRQEGEYSLFLEYEYNSSGNLCSLKEIYFSLLFNEKKEEMENFFKFR